MNPFGFDLIIFNDCIEFSMEKCQHISRFGEEDKKSLFEMLVKLHKYKIMHLDINPFNIMYSPYHKRNVFIDFGLSKVIK